MMKFRKNPATHESSDTQAGEWQVEKKQVFGGGIYSEREYYLRLFQRDMEFTFDLSYDGMVEALRDYLNALQQRLTDTEQRQVVPHCMGS